MDVLSSLLGGESLQDIFSKTINGWFGDLVSNAFEVFDGIMTGMLKSVFHFEDFVISGSTSVLTDESIRSTYLFIYLVACSLAILKFLFKGFQIYILWRDGDADSSPRDMLVGTIQAGVVMVCFPFVYEKAANIFIYLAEGIMGRLGVSEGLQAQTVIGVIATGGFLIILLLLIFSIMVFILWVRLLGRGVELLIMRFGIPFAALGLLDSDMGMFKGYSQIFLKTGFTTIIQISLMALAFRVAGTFQFLNIMGAIAILTTAFATPAIMQQILVASRGGSGGISQKVYSAGMAIRAIRNLA